MYYVYMIRCHDNSLYTGITNQLQKRMKEHYYKKKEGAKYTRARTVTKLEVVWSTHSRSDACKLEYYIKSLSKKHKEVLLGDPTSIDIVEQQWLSDVSLESCLEE